MRYLAHTKTYRSKNGNTYWSSRVTDNDRDVVYILPFQYGYGNHSTSVISELLNIEIRETIIFKINNNKGSKTWKHTEQSKASEQVDTIWRK